MNKQTIRYDALVATYYTGDQPTDKLMIVAVGAPGIRDSADLPCAEFLVRAGYDVIVPDYYGFSRSDGVFTPESSIATIVDTKQFFEGGGIVTDVYTFASYQVQYSQFVLMGISYGGMIMPLVSRYSSQNIDAITLMYPLLEYSTLGDRNVPEETVEDFLMSLRLGFGPLYRGIDLPVWKQQFMDQLGLTPTLCTQYVRDIPLYIAHGTEDTSIYYKKSYEYAQKLMQQFPDQPIRYAELSGRRHGKDALVPGIYDMMIWLRSVNDGSATTCEDDQVSPCSVLSRAG